MEQLPSDYMWEMVESFEKRLSEYAQASRFPGAALSRGIVLPLPLPSTQPDPNPSVTLTLLLPLILTWVMCASSSTIEVALLG